MLLPSWRRLEASKGGKLSRNLQAPCALAMPSGNFDAWTLGDVGHVSNRHSEPRSHLACLMEPAHNVEKQHSAMTPATDPSARGKSIAGQLLKTT